jgi:hypothetical protein
MAEPTVVRLPQSTGGDPEACEAVTRKLAVACVALSLRHGWPVVLDSMLSAYVTLAVERVGAPRVAEVLTELADALLNLKRQN